VRSHGEHGGNNPWFALALLVCVCRYLEPQLQSSLTEHLSKGSRSNPRELVQSRKKLSFLQFAAQRDGSHPRYTPQDHSGPAQIVCAWEEHNEAILVCCELSRHRYACTNMPPS